MLIPKKNEVRKPSRSASGVVPVAVMLPPRKCKHGTCLYCPSLNVPQSYTPKSPVVLRASQVNYDACEQVKARIKAFEIMNHPTDKIELIIMGGTFLEYPEKFQYEFVKGCYDGLNGRISSKDTASLLSQHKNLQAGDSGEPSVNLKSAKKFNENAKHRCVALCIETRPDVCVDYIDRLMDFGCTRVELGVQAVSDKIYKKIKRGHVVQDVVETTKALKNAGFKIGYHVMPGLPGINAKKDLELFKKLFSDEKFKPDQLKIYPCQVLKGSGLEKIYWKGKYKPYTKEETENILVKMLKIVPRYCRVMRVMREIPPEYLVAGTTRIDLRKEVESEFRNKKYKIKEIRFREAGFADKKNLNGDLKLHHGRTPKDFRKKSLLRAKITKYKASDGVEYFLEIVNKEDILFGLLRLRIVTPKGVPSASENNDAGGKAIIRELHVYGRTLNLGEKSKNSVQHAGLGKWLMQEAEEIVKKQGIKKLAVISGVGVREYYRKLGYKLYKGYMIKKF